MLPLHYLFIIVLIIIQQKCGKVKYYDKYSCKILLNIKENSLSENTYLDFITGTHSLYDRYYNDWQLCIKSWYGGVEYKDAKYLRAYQVDLNTPSETINTFVMNDDGSMVSKHRAKVEYGTSSNETEDKIY